MATFVERQSERFVDFARVFAPELCSLPGSVDDISREGFKARIPMVVAVDFDAVYEIALVPYSAVGEKQFVLTCSPRWSKEENGMTCIGFQILPSRDYANFLEYIETIAKAAQMQESQIVGSVCRFV